MKTMEADVVVIGGGPSGLAATAQSAENGMSVILLEKANVVGGAANMGMGPLGIGTKQQSDMMVDIDVERAFKKFVEYTHWRTDARLVKRYFENSGDTIKWLEETCGVEFAGAYKYFPKSEATWHIVAVNGGIKINEFAQVLDNDWNKVPGLFAAGTDTCTIYGDSYMFLLPGNTMGYCVNTGRFAGDSASDYVNELEN